MATADVYGIEIVKGLAIMAGVVGLLSEKGAADRLLAAVVGTMILLVAWPLVGGVMFVAANLGAEGVEAIGGTEISASLRLLIAKIGAFVLLAFFCARHVYDELSTPPNVRSRPAVAGPAKSVFRKVAYK